MGKFDKQAYDMAYAKEDTTLYGWRMCKELRPKLDEYSRARGIPPAELLRQLVDADAIAHGLPRYSRTIAPPSLKPGGNSPSSFFLKRVIQYFRTMPLNTARPRLR